LNNVAWLGAIKFCEFSDNRQRRQAELSIRFAQKVQRATSRVVI